VGDNFPEPNKADGGGYGEFEGDVLNLISDFLMTIFSPGGEIAGFIPERITVFPLGLLVSEIECTGACTIYFVSF
jgi:hypothetical protein